MMTDTQARTLREAHNAYIKQMARMPVAKLAAFYAADLADQGRQIVFGGPRTRDELMRALGELHYPAAKLNEAVHVTGHDTHGYTACNFCHDDDGTHNGSLCECDRHVETDCTVCGRMAAFHFSTTYHRGGDQRPTLRDHGMLGHEYQGVMRCRETDACMCPDCRGRFDDTSDHYPSTEGV